MRIFSYRNKRFLKITLLVLLGAALAAAAFIVGRFYYLARFVVYEKGQARLDYSQTLRPTGAVPQQSDAADYPFDVVMQTQELLPDTEPDVMQKLSGYYITTNMLASDVEAVRQALLEIPDLSCVMMDVKSIFGNFYYHSELSGAQIATVDVDAVEALIRELAEDRHIYLIARFPAFCDPNYALAHQSQGLPLYSGALWTDENNCYWLNPYSNDVQGYLSSLALELEGWGFDEVVLGDFYFPESDRIAWTSQSVSRQEAVEDAADHIRANLVGSAVRLSFGTRDSVIASFADRIYVEVENPSEIEGIQTAMQDVLTDSAVQIVFVTESRDTRFGVCGVLRPLLESSAD